MTRKKVTDDDLLRAKARWDEGRAEAGDAREDMVDLIRQAVDEGKPQSEIGRLYDWPRQRVAKLL